MSLSTKIDYFDLEDSVIAVKGAAVRNKDYAVKSTAVNERGDIIARDLAGLRESPTVDYNVIAAGNIAPNLGQVNTLSDVVYCLNRVEVKTSAGSAPIVSAGGESLQDGATVSSTYDLGSIALSPRHKAQILFAAFTLSGSGCSLTECSAVASCTITRATKDGATLAHDVSGGTVVITGKVVQTGATAPTITAASGFTLTVPPTEENPDEGQTTWSFEVTKDSLLSVEPV